MKKFVSAAPPPPSAVTLRTGRNRRWRPAKRQTMSDDELRELLGLRPAPRPVG